MFNPGYSRSGQASSRQHHQYQQSQIAAARLARSIMQRASRPVSWHPSSSQLLQSMGPVGQMASVAPNQVPTTLAVPEPSWGEASALPMTDSMPMQNPADERLLQLAGNFDLEYMPQMYLPMQPAMVDESSTWSQPMVTAAMDSSFPTLVPDLGSSQNAMANVDQVNVTPSTVDLTAPPTPEACPLQMIPTLPETEEESTEKDGDTGEELVGVGLYDEPEDYRAFKSLGGSDFRRPSGKGLVLEQTFSPPNKEDDGDAEDNNEAEEDSKQG